MVDERFQGLATAISIPLHRFDGTSHGFLWLAKTGGEQRCHPCDILYLLAFHP
jgi:hypothetical protein